MSTISNYKSYKKYLPQYDEWKSERDLINAKKQEYLKQNPQELHKKDIQKGRTLLRAIDVMDEYSQKRGENMELATQQVMAIANYILITLGMSIGFLFRNNKTLHKFCSKFCKNNNNVNNIAISIAPLIGGLSFIAIGAYPLNTWAAKKEIQASRLGRFEAMVKELNNPKTFAILEPEQQQELDNNLNIMGVVREKKNPIKGLKENFSAIKDLATPSKKFLIVQRLFEQKIQDEKLHFDKELTPEEIEKAKQDQQLLTNIIEKIDIASQDYAENTELALNFLCMSVFALGQLFSLGYEKLAAKLNWKSSMIPQILSIVAMVGAGIFSTEIQKKASRVGRFKVKQELLQNPEQLAYVGEEKTNSLSNFNITPQKKTNIFKFLLEAWKNNRAYKKWEKTEGLREKNIAKAIENIELTDEQLEDAQRLQHNTFKTFNKIDENSQKYSESIEALGQSIQAPLEQLFVMIGAIVGSKFFSQALSATSPAKRNINLIKYMTTCFVSTLPAIGINAYITKEQKKASRVADMLAIQELADYRNFADYRRFQSEK